MALRQSELVVEAEPVPVTLSTGAESPADAEHRAPRSLGRRLSMIACSTWLVVVIGSAITADWLPIANPSKVRPVDRLQGSSWDHPFGTDNLGRDLFARAVFGSRVSLIVGFASVAIGLVIGSAIGIVAGYMRGRVDGFISWLMDVVLSFPSLVLLIALVAYTGGGLKNICIGLGLLSVPVYARLARAHAMTVGGEEFVLAARASGAGRMRILWREIMPNVLPAITAYGLVSVSLAIVVEGSLSFLGLSVSTPTPSWGGLIASGQGFLRQSATWVIYPAAVLCLTVLCLNVLGERFRRRYEEGING